MKLTALIGDVERVIGMDIAGDEMVITIDGLKMDLDVSEPEPGTYLIKSVDGVFEAFVSHGGPNGMYEVTIGNRTVSVEVFDPKRLRSAKAGAGSTEGLVEIKSAMPGKIVKVLASVGDNIETGDGLVVVEAMKMQNELKSPKAGIVKQILVNEDDRVNSGDLLVVVE